MQWAFALTSLVPLVIHLVLGRRVPFALEGSEPKVTLYMLEDSIIESLDDPSPESSSSIIDEIHSYNAQFSEIFEGFKDRVFRFVRVAHLIYDKGGPSFLKVRIDGPVFLKVSGWTMSVMGEFYEALKSTHRLWLEFKNEYEEVKTALNGNWSQLNTVQTKPNIAAILQEMEEAELAKAPDLENTPDEDAEYVSDSDIQESDDLENMSDGDTPDDDIPDDEVADGEDPEGDIAEGEDPDGEIPDGDIAEGEDPENTSCGDIPDGDNVENTSDIDISENTSNGASTESIQKNDVSDSTLNGNRTESISDHDVTESTSNGNRTE